MQQRTLTPQARKELERLWFTYGNHARLHSDAGHKFIQVLLESGQDERDFFHPPEDLVALVDAIFKGKAEPVARDGRIVCPICTKKVTTFTSGLSIGMIRSHGSPVCQGSRMLSEQAVALAKAIREAGEAWWAKEDEAFKLSQKSFSDSWSLKSIPDEDYQKAAEALDALLDTIQTLNKEADRLYDIYQSMKGDLS